MSNIVTISGFNNVINTIHEYYILYRLRLVDYYIKKYLNINNERDAIRLVKYLSSISKSTEEIVDILTNYFTKNIPDDIFLQKISLLIQKNNNESNIISYSLITIWISVTQAIIETQRRTLLITN